VEIFQKTIWVCFQAQEYLNEKNKMTRDKLIDDMIKFKLEFCPDYDIRLAPFED